MKTLLLKTLMLSIVFVVATSVSGYIVEEAYAADINYAASANGGVASFNPNPAQTKETVFVGNASDINDENEATYVGITESSKKQPSERRGEYEVEAMFAPTEINRIEYVVNRFAQEGTYGTRHVWETCFLEINGQWQEINYFHKQGFPYSWPDPITVAITGNWSNVTGVKLRAKVHNYGGELWSNALKHFTRELRAFGPPPPPSSPPTIISILPSDIGKLGDTITITGTNFGGYPYEYYHNYNSDADINEDDVINTLDFQILRDSLWTQEGDLDYNINADINKDGAINTVDRRLLRASLGTSKGVTYVEFNVSAIPVIMSWTDTEIVCTVPYEAITGALYVVTVIGASNGVDFTVATPPTADFKAYPNRVSPEIAVQFTDLSTGSIDTWSWDFDGDGSEDALGPGPHFYLYPLSPSTDGAYSPSLTVTGPGGDDDTMTKTDEIYVNENYLGGPTRRKNRKH